MKKLLIVFLLFVSGLFANSQTTAYMATNGSDANSGSISSPVATIEKLATLITTPGSVGIIRGGTYRSVKSTSIVNRNQVSNLNGNSSNRITIKAADGETVIFNCDEQLIPGSSGDGPVIMKFINCSYLTVQRIRLTGLAQNPANINTPCGLIFSNVDNSNFTQIEVDNIGGYGWYYQDGSDNNYMLNCDVHHCGDQYSGWGGANGFNITGGDASTNNTWEGCRAWWCSDDGWDFYGTNTVAILKNCWAFWNGYIPGTFTTAGDGQGFKLGPMSSNLAGSSTVYRRLERCVGFENRVNGFDQNSQSNTACLIEMYNCTAANNGSNGFFYGANTSINQRFKNNINYNNGLWGDEITSGSNVSNNTWNGGVTLSSGDFVSTSSTGVDGARGADGGLPVLNFMKLATGSDLIDAGTTISGITFNGSAPDMGAFESGTTPPPASNGSGTRKILFNPKKN